MFVQIHKLNKIKIKEGKYYRIKIYLSYCMFYRRNN